MNIKCADCGLVNWSTEIECKRCGSLLTVQEKRAQNIPFTAIDSKPFFSRSLQVLTAILGLALLMIVLIRVVHLVSDDVAVMSAITFALVGFVLSMLTHVWLLWRIFQQSVGWGFGSLFVPFVGLFAVARFWDKTRRSFVGHLICLGILLTAFVLLPPEFGTQAGARR